MPTRYFLRDTSLDSTERTMQIPAGFRPRGGGIRVPRHYTAEDCVCFPERLGAGCVPQRPQAKMGKNARQDAQKTNQFRKLKIR